VASADGKVEGALMGTQVVLFGREGAVTGSTSYSVTAAVGSIVTHHVTDLVPSATYQLEGANQTSATASAQGVLTFTTSGTGAAQMIVLTPSTTSAIPGTPDLVAASDTGTSSTDNVTNRDNGVAGKTLRFTVPNTVSGATVAIYADGTAIGSATASGTTTTVTTIGDFDLVDGSHAIIARQLEPLKNESAASTGLNVVIDTTAPAATIQPVTPDPRPVGIDSIVIGFDEAVSGFGISNLTLTRDSGPNLLTASNALTTPDNVTFTLSNLLSSSSTSGSYQLTLTGAGSGVTDAAGNALFVDASDAWVHSLPAWLSASGSDASWNSLTKTLTLTGRATITADPAAEAPLVSASGAVAVLTIEPNVDTVIRLASLALSNAASAVLPTHGLGPVRVLVVNGDPLIGPGCALDLADNAMIVRNGTTAEIRARIAAAFHQGDWLGTGTGSAGVITSSAAAEDSNAVTALGFASNAELHRTDFAGVTGLNSTDVLIRYTSYGDSDLSGAVNLDDFTLFMAGFRGTAGTSERWLFGDFDYSGVVNLDDFTLFLAGYQRS
jgi:hypothetical protein